MKKKRLKELDIKLEKLSLSPQQLSEIKGGATATEYIILL